MPKDQMPMMPTPIDKKAPKISVNCTAENMRGAVLPFGQTTSINGCKEYFDTRGNAVSISLPRLSHGSQ
jgi:hypothetical protein